MKKVLLFLGMLTFLCSYLTAQVSIVKDIDSRVGVNNNAKYDRILSEQFLYINNFCTIGNTTFFVANNQLGRELWKTDGTPEGTLLVKDIYPGYMGSNIKNLVELNGVLYFIARANLYTSDGTNAGTKELVKINPDPDKSSGVSSLCVFNNELYFSANNGSQGIELWKYDPVNQCADLVKDIVPGASGSNPKDFIEFKGELYFAAYENGVSQLWKTDGTTSGTVALTNLTERYLSSPFSNFTIVGETMFFSGYKSEHGPELWKTDGTQAGTMMVKDIFEGLIGSSPVALTEYNGTLFFVANDGLHGHELWTSDGTTEGTILLKDLKPGAYGDYITNMVTYNGMLYLGHGSKLWKSDGTASGTTPVKTIARIDFLTLINGKILFSAYNSDYGEELWQSDGTTGGTTLLKDINPARSSIVSNITNVNGEAYFSANDGDGIALWKSDGTEAGTVKIKQIATPYSSSAPGVSPDTERMYFSARDNTNLRYLWKTDGTEAGTYIVTTKCINPKKMFEIGETLYFTATIPGKGGSLWKTDGTDAGTVLLSDDHRINYYYFINLNGTLYFVARDNTNSWKLWKSDGTETGTVVIKTIPDNGYFSMGKPIVVNGNIYFRGPFQNELWKSDGTEAGTQVMKTFGNRVSTLWNIYNTLYIVADDGTSGYELWKSDGTESGTVLFKDINPGAYSSIPRNLTEFTDDKFVFTANDGVHKDAIWISDGTEAGTQMIKNFEVRMGGRSMKEFISYNGSVFFSVILENTGQELWKTDGTEQGTVMVKDIYPGSKSSYPRLFVVHDNLLFFRAYNEHGLCLWRSDGTEAGTQLAGKVHGGFLKNHIKVAENVLYFTAIDYRGRELWRYSPGLNTPPVITSNGGSETASIQLADNRTKVTTIEAYDNEVQDITYEISGGSDAAKFTIDPTSGELSFITAPQYDNPTDSDSNNSYIVQVSAVDILNASDNQTITVNIIDGGSQNTAPQFTEDCSCGDIISYPVNENEIQIATISAEDPEGSPINYSVNGTDAAFFSISQSGVLSFNAPPDFENPLDANTDNVYEISITIDDGDLSASKEFKISVINIADNQKPEIITDGGGSTANVQADENQNYVTTVTATDAENNEISYSMPYGIDKNKFSINETTGELRFLVPPDFETPDDSNLDNTYIVTVRANDLGEGNVFDQQTIYVEVQNVAETYNITNLSQDIFTDETICPQTELKHITNTDLTTYANLVKADDNYINCDNITDDLTNTNRSVFLWMRKETTVSGSGQVFVGINSSSGGNICNLQISTNEQLGIYEGSSTVSSGVVVTDNQWHFVGYTYNHSSNQTKIYIDGVLRKTFTNSQKISAGTEKISIGQEYDSGLSTGNFYDGIITQVSFWNEVLELEDVEQIMQEAVNPNSPKYQNLVAYYPMVAQGADLTDIVDYSGNNNNGTASHNDIQIIDDVVQIPDYNAATNYNASWSVNSSEVSTSNTLSIADPVAGDYQLNLTTDYFSILDNWKVDLYPAPEITAQPQNTTAALGGNAEFTVTTNGDISLQWYKILDGAEKLLLGGATGNTLTLSSVTEDMNGSQYAVEVKSNETGCNLMSNTVTLTIGTITTPTVTTTTAIGITATSALTGGDVTDDGGVAITARGVCWSTTSNPTIDNDKNTEAGTTGVFSSTISDLQPNTQYYYRAYATNSQGTAYGSEKIFTTPKQSQSITFMPIPEKTYGDASFELTATASSALSITYSSSDENVATVTGSTVNIIGAGTTTITASQSGDDTYFAANNAIQGLVVNKAELIAKAEDKSREIGVANPAFTITYSGFVLGEDKTVIDVEPTASCDATISSPADDYTILLTGGSDNNYEIILRNGMLSVNAPAKQDQTITYNPLPDKTYGAPAFNLSATSTSGLPVTYTSSDPNIVSISNSIATITGTGAVTITAQQTGNSSYNAATPVPQSFTVNKATLTVIAHDKQVGYGDAIPEYTYEITGFVYGETDAVVQNTPAITCTYTNTTPVSASPLVIDFEVGTLAADNYTFITVDAGLTITKATQTINFDPLNDMVYGDADFDITVTSTSGLTVDLTSLNTDVATVTGSTISITGAGTATIKASQAGDANFMAASDVFQTLTIEKALLAVSADDITVTYADASPVYTFSLEGFVNGDNSSVVTGEPALICTYSATTPAGESPVAIQCKEGSLFADNYDFSYTNGKLFINKKTQTITFDALADKLETDPDFDLTATASSELDVFYISSTAAVATVVNSTVSINGAGTTTITASQTGDQNFDAATPVDQNLNVIAVYSVTFNVTTNGTFPIMGVTLTVDGKTYATDDNGQVIVMLPAGNYDYQTNLAAFIPQSGNITVTGDQTVDIISPPAAFTVFFTIKNESDEDIPGAKITIGNVSVITDAYGNETFDLQDDIYTYNISKEGYADATGEFEIYGGDEFVDVYLCKAPTSIPTEIYFGTKTDNLIGVSGWNEPTEVPDGYLLKMNTANAFTQPLTGEDPTASGQYLGGEQVIYKDESNLYGIDVDGLSPVTDYYFAVYAYNNCGVSKVYSNSALIVKESSDKIAQTITFSPIAGKIYGDADFKPDAFSDQGLPVTFTTSDPNVAVVLSGKIHIIGAGTCTVFANQAGDATRKAATEVSQTLTVAKTDLTVTADNKTVKHGENAPEFTYSFSGFVNGDTESDIIGSATLNSTYTNTTPVSASPVAINCTTGSLWSTDYNFNFVSGQLIIEQGNQTITFDALETKTYGDADFDLTATASSGLTVSYESSNPDVATISGSTVTITGAGTTTITASQLGDANYIEAAAVTQELKVNKALLTATAKDIAVIYGDVPPVYSFNLSGFVNGDDESVVTGSPTLVCNYTTGTPVSASPMDIMSLSGSLLADDYTFAYENGELTINKQDQIITFNPPATKNANDPPFTLTASATSGLQIDFTSSTASVATVTGSIVTIAGAGTTTLTATQAGNVNYNPASVDKLLTVSEVHTVTFSVTYDGTNPLESVSILVDNKTYTTDATGEVNVLLPAGNFAYSASKAAYTAQSGNVNVTGNQTVNIMMPPAAYSIFFNVSSATGGTPVQGAEIEVNSVKIYTDAEGKETIDLTNGIYTYNIVKDGFADAAGTVDITGGDATEDVTLCPAPQNPATLLTFSDITDNSIKITGWTSPVGGADGYIMVMNTDNTFSTPTNGYNPTAQTAYTGVEQVIYNGTDASATVTITGLSAVTTYYFAVYAYNDCSGSNTYETTGLISSQSTAKTDQTITFNAFTPKTYGDPDFAISASASSGLPIAFATSDNAVAVELNGKVHITGAGTCTIYANQAGDATYNQAPQQSQTLTVAKAVLTVTADNTSVVYGDPEPTYTYQFSGFVNGDTENLISGVPAINTSYTNTTPVSSSPLIITTNIGSLSANNYDFATVNGELTISKTNQTISFDPVTTKTYGDADFNLSATASSGSIVSFESSNPAVASIVGNTVTIEGAGTTEITASQAGNSDYNAAADVKQTLTVNKAMLTVTAQNEAVTYGDAPPVYTYNITGFVNGDNATSVTGTPALSSNYTATSSVSLSPMDILCQTGTLTAPDYNFTFVNGELSIAKSDQTITFGALANKTYGDIPFDLTATAGTGLTVDYSSSVSSVATVFGSTVTIKGVGTTTITASQTGSPNYNPAANVQQTLTVNPGSIVITANNQTKAFGSSYAFMGTEFTSTGLAYNDAITSVELTSPGTTFTATVGTYNITPANASGTGLTNYNISYVNGVMTVFEITNTWDGTSWSIEQPGVGIDGVIQANYTVGVSQSGVNHLEVENLTVDAGYTLTVPEEKSLTIHGDLTVNGNMLLQSINASKTPGSLITKGSISGTGQMKAQRMISGNKYHWVSLPMQNGDANSGDFAAYQFMKYDYAAYYDKPYSGAVEPMNCYTALYDGDHKITLTGTYNTESAGQNSITLQAGTDMTYLGNPYPSAISFDAIADRINSTDLYPVIYYLREGCWDYYDKDNPTWSVPAGTNGIIPAWQGFSIYAYSGITFDVTDADRVHDNKPFYKSGSYSEGIRLKVSSANGQNSETVIRFAQNAGLMFEPQFDAKKRFEADERPQIYTQSSDNINLAINAIASPEATTYKMPVVFEAKQSGAYTISAPQIELMDYQTVLEDRETGVFTDLSENSYAFNCKARKNSERFILHFVQNGMSIENSLQSEPQIYSHEHSIYVQLPETTSDATIEVFDLTGRRIISTQSADKLTKIEMGKAGMYLVRVKNENGISTEKVFVR